MGNELHGFDQQRREITDEQLKEMGGHDDIFGKGKNNWERAVWDGTFRVIRTGKKNEKK
jgi:hypothetical protein